VQRPAARPARIAAPPGRPVAGTVAESSTGASIAPKIPPVRPVRPSPQRQVVSAAVKEGATEAALNLAGALRDLIADVRSANRWLKYKALIIGAWVALSLAGFWVAWPSDPGPTNTLGARLVRTRVVDTPVFMIVNESGEPWEDVVVEVNHSYRASVRRVSAEHPENNITLEPRRLLGEGGAPAPFNLEVTDLHVRTSDGQADLIVGGRQSE
jgi:hypothetical protein